MDGGMNGVEGRGRIREIWTQGRKGGKEEKGEKGEAEEHWIKRGGPRASSRIKRCFTREPAAFQRVTLMQGKGWKATERDDYAD